MKISLFVKASIFLSCLQSYSQELMEYHINSGSISNNVNCGIGEIFIIPQALNSENIVENNEIIVKDNIQFYPNPVKDILNISTSLQVKSINVFTIDGKLISEFNLQEQKQLDLSHISSGTYILVSNESVFKSIIIIKD